MLTGIRRKRLTPARRNLRGASDRYLLGARQVGDAARHVDGLLLFLDLMGAVDAERDDGHHVAFPCAVFSPLRYCREAAPSVPGARIFESRLNPVKQFHFRWRWTGVRRPSNGRRGER